MAVIIIAPPEDVHALTVAWEIEQCGETPIVLNTADFPSRWSISFTATERERPRFDLTMADGRVLEDEAIRGVWWRRTRRMEISEAVTDTRHRNLCREDCLALLEGWVHALGSRVVNPLDADLKARRKPLQLAKASLCGLRMPATVISNSPEDVGTFLSRRDGDFIYKPLTSPQWTTVPTRPLDDDARRNLDLLRLAPSIIQQRIDGGADIRVTVVDDEMFAAEIRAVHPDAQLDWRLDLAMEITAHVLPDEVAQSIHRMQSELGLRYGAYDFRIDAEGRYWFFEVNSCGQYLFVEIATQQKISQAMARALISGPAATSQAKPAISSDRHRIGG